MKPNPDTQTETMLDGATPALRRAAQRARMVVRRTGTPLLLGKAGRVEERWLDGKAAATLREDFQKYGAGVPEASPPENDRLD
jgi:hypothetical protein